VNDTSVSIVSISEEFNSSTTVTTSGNACSTTNSSSTATGKSAAGQTWRVNTLVFMVAVVAVVFLEINDTL
jgi:hypothetical protein